MSKQKKKRRSAAWFDNPERPDATALHLERYLNYGLTVEELQSGKPIIGIAQSGSDLAACNRHHLQLAERIREGIRDRGGIPMEFPIHPIFENGRRPTAALDRNLAFLGLVEILHGYPLDGVVLTTGCDKTTPAMLMAAALVDIPSIVFSGGPMLNGWDGEERVGSGAIIWRSREQLAAGELDYPGFIEQVAKSAPSAGHCNTMGTALTMNSLAEVMGMSLPGCAAIPAPYRERGQMAYATGLRIVDMIDEDLKPSDILVRASFLNAIAATTALGGSTNAPPHLQAIANQVGVELSISDWQSHGEALPLLVNCQPSGEFLGEEFHRAGGVPALLGEMLEERLVNGDCLTVTGRTLAENNAGAKSLDTRVIRPASQPLTAKAGFAVLSGNLFDSAILKKSVISEAFRERYLSSPDTPNCFRARAIVFEGPEDYHQRINDPALNIDEHCMLVIRHCGPVAYPGSAEVVNMLPPDYLVRHGITELPCMGDGRQSGTSASPSILNISPEAAVGGGLALLQTGDMIEVDLDNNRVDALLEDEELSARRQTLVTPQPINQTPWQEIYRETVTQLDAGADMKLRDAYHRIHDTHGIPRDSH